MLLGSWGFSIMHVTTLKARYFWGLPQLHSRQLSEHLSASVLCPLSGRSMSLPVDVVWFEAKCFQAAEHPA